MNKAGAVLQLALFALVQADDGLVARYAPLAEADMSPTFSYDGMRSQWLDRSVLLSRHAIEFSVWNMQAAFAEGDDIAGVLIRAMSNLALDAPFEMVHMRLQAIETGFDGGSRLWRQQLEFEALVREVSS